LVAEVVAAVVVVEVVAAAVAVVAAVVVAEGGKWNHETEQNQKDKTILCRRFARCLLFSITESAGNDCTEFSQGKILCDC
jgi:hypothetical protein